MANFPGDHPTYTDSLGRLELLEEVGKYVTTCRAPQVIGIYGDWGSGKTSFLRSLQLYLARPLGEKNVEECKNQYEKHYFGAGAPDDDERFLEGEGIANILALGDQDTTYPVIWFDAWLYQAEATPVVALLHEIRRQFSTGSRLAEMLKKDARIAVESALLAFEPVAKAISFLAPGAGFIGKAVSNVSVVAQRVETERYEVALSSDQIRAHLNHAVKTILDHYKPEHVEKSFWRTSLKDAKSYRVGRRLVIVIDDLDRCEPEMALKLLEGIKLFFNLDQCVFVMGLNSKRLTDHIGKLYGGEADKDGNKPDFRHHAAKDYLDKIVNQHYWLGLCSANTDMLERFLPDNSVVVKAPLPVSQGNVSPQTYDISQNLRWILTTYRCLPPNPRKIKRFLATLMRFNQKAFETQPDLGLLITCAYLHSFYPEILRKSVYYPEYFGKFVSWIKDRIEDQVPEWLAFKSLIEPGKGPNGSGKGTFPDPIYDQVLQIEALLAAWDLQPNFTNKELVGYSLLS